MNNRKGEKIGWTGGWLGSFLWVLALSIVFIIQGKAVAGLFGLIISLIAVFLILFSSPWRHPDASYIILLIPLYALLAVSVLWAVWGFGEEAFAGLSWWTILMLLPLLTPLFVLGNKRWRDGGE